MNRVNWLKNKKQIICIAILFVYVLMLNFLTPYVADDFQYMFSFKTGERITSLWQIFPSLYYHYLNDIGRIVPHFLAQVFLMGPKWIFNLVNAVCFVLLIYIMITSTSMTKNFSAILWFMVPILFWQFVPCFGQVFLWEDGCFNYLWSFTFAAVYLIPYLRLFLKREQGWLCRVQKNERVWKICFCIFTFFYGNYSENVSFSTIFVSFIMLLFVMIEEKSVRKYSFYIIPVFCGALGYLIMLFSPGEATHMGSKGLGSTIKAMIDVFEKFYAGQKTLLILWAVLMVIAIYCRISQKCVILSALFLLISVINVLLIGFGSYYAERSLAAGTVFLIWAIVVLMQALRQGRVINGVPTECIVYVVGIYFIAGSLLNIWNGSYDIYETNRRNSEREAYIMEQVENGVKELTVAQIEPATTYCAKYGVADIFTKEQNATWLNKAIAEYYGLEMIYGETNN